MSTNTPIDQAKALLGEHYANYVIIVQPEPALSNYELTYSCPFATKTLLDLANNHQQTFLEGGTDLEEWVWEEEEDEEMD